MIGMHRKLPSLVLAFSFWLGESGIHSNGLQAQTPGSTAPRPERASGWEVLFNGSSTDAFRGFKKPAFPETGWRIEDHCLVHASKGGGGDIITKQSYQEFELVWDWKVAEGGNSGVKYFILEERGAAIGHEYQMIDDERHSDAKTGALHQTAAFYDVLPPVHPKLKPAGQWNHSRIKVQGDQVEHWLNGSLALKYRLGSPEVVDGIAKSKFKKVEGFGTSVAGHILLQDHGDEVWFKNIKIRNLKK